MGGSEIVAVGVGRLVGHGRSANRMGKAAFGKLKGHIARTGRYEPIVVRRHPRRRGCFEIINGHQRVAALREIGATEADCIVWDVEDDEAMVLLATLNRLRGKDDVHAKVELIRRLRGRYEMKELVKMVPESRASIDRLGRVGEKVKRTKKEAFLNPEVFFVDDGEAKVVEEAIDAAVKDGEAGTAAVKRRRAIVRICGTYLRSKQ
jgi:ParB-like chromosome segregation protein Spo0J